MAEEQSMTDEPIKYMDLDEFADSGFLQEANRMFFHPLGLALEVSDSDQDHHYDTLRIWDYRDDPEGVIFNEGLSLEKAAHVEAEAAKHVRARLAMYHTTTVQPIPDGPKIERANDLYEIVGYLTVGGRFGGVFMTSKSQLDKFVETHGVGYRVLYGRKGELTGG